MEQTAAGSTSALRRKMAAALDEAPGHGGGHCRQALGALRLGLARGASEELDLPVAVFGVRQSRCVQGDLTTLLDGDRLLVVLDGPKGSAGAVALDRTLLSGLIQHQTMGLISNGTPDDRPFTGTDAAMSAPLLNGMLARAPDLADIEADRRCMTGFRFGAQAEGTQALLLILETEKYRVFTLTVELAGGLLQGEMRLILPDLPIEPDEAAEDGADQTDATAGQQFGGVRAELNAVICQMRLPLSQLAALQTGDVVPLAMPDGLAKTRLCTITGDALSFGRLGRINGMRAVRVNESSLQPMIGTSDNTGEFLPETGGMEPLLPTPFSTPEPLAGDIDLMGDLPDLPTPPDFADLPDLPDIGDFSGAEASLPAVIPGIGDLDDLAAPMSQAQTRAEITELAGLTEDFEDGAA